MKADHMELTESERALILAGRAEQEQLEAAKVFQQKAIETASAWLIWAKEDGHGLTCDIYKILRRYGNSCHKQGPNLGNYVLHIPKQLDCPAVT